MTNNDAAMPSGVCIHTATVLAAATQVAIQITMDRTVRTKAPKAQHLAWILSGGSAVAWIWDVADFADIATHWLAWARLSRGRSGFVRVGDRSHRVVAGRG